MPNIGLTELLVIGAIAMLLFGSRLPKVGKSLGEGIRNFKKGLSGEEETPEGTPSGQAPQVGARESEPGTPEKPRVSSSVAPTSLAGGITASQASQETKRPSVVDAEHPESSERQGTSHNPKA
jgi:sec-independent protein translocase protein TatA